MLGLEQAKTILTKMAVTGADVVKDATNGVNLPKNDPNLMITSILNMAYAVAGIVAVGFIIYGGVTYATSVGDPSKIKKASQTLLYSIIGLVVVLLAAAITNFVLTAAGN